MHSWRCCRLYLHTLLFSVLVKVGCSISTYVLFSRKSYHTFNNHCKTKPVRIAGSREVQDLAVERTAARGWEPGRAVRRRSRVGAVRHPRFSNPFSRSLSRVLPGGEGHATIPFSHSPFQEETKMVMVPATP